MELLNQQKTYNEWMRYVKNHGRLGVKLQNSLFVLRMTVYFYSQIRAFELSLNPQSNNKPVKL